jgi:predicted transposase YdaD
VIRLWEQPTDVFLQLPGLLPLAALTQAQDRAEVLRQVSDLASQIPDEIQRNNIIGSTAILAGLVLEKDLVERILRRDIVKESTVYQSLREEILEEKTRQIALKMVQRGMPLEAIADITDLSIAQIQQLQATGTPPPES